ncbi:uncharacterized protein LOC135465427 [Liolophura sinensis]|uniref:uncharacterized protein LOC135465427 n=1 Tax=Liolophura sinensis TaxID=3198878 RepID=UPI003159616B
MGEIEELGSSQRKRTSFVPPKHGETGFGSGFLNLSIIATVTKYFTRKRQGKAVSTVLTCYAVSPLITLFVYRRWFAHGQIEDDAGQDFHGFMLSFAITIAVVGCLLLGVSRFSRETESSELSFLNDTDSEDVAKSTGEGPSGLRTKIVQETQTIFQWPLQMLIWSFTLSYPVVTGIDYDLALYAKSSGLYTVFDSIFVVFQVILFLSRLAVGFISDALVETIPRTSYIAVTSFFLAVCLCVMSVLPTAELTMYMLSITTDLAGGVVKLVLVTVLVQNIGKENFAKNWGIAYSLTSVFVTIWAAMFSSV